MLEYCMFTIATGFPSVHRNKTHNHWPMRWGSCSARSTFVHLPGNFSHVICMAMLIYDAVITPLQLFKNHVLNVVNRLGSPERNMCVKIVLRFWPISFENFEVFLKLMESAQNHFSNCLNISSFFRLFLHIWPVKIQNIISNVLELHKQIRTNSL